MNISIRGYIREENVKDILYYNKRYIREENGKVVMCYFGSWSVYRNGEGNGNITKQNRNSVCCGIQIKRQFCFLNIKRCIMLVEEIGQFDGPHLISYVGMT